MGDRSCNIQSLIKDDPLYSEDYPDVSDMIEAGPPPLHTPEMTGLNALLEIEYNMIAFKFAIGPHVSLAMYKYFGSMIAWARLLKVHMMNQYGYDEWMRRFVQSVEYGRFMVPPMLQAYIDGIGNFTLPFGRMVKLKLPNLHLCTSESGHGGYFGKIEEHVELYAQLVSPGVLVDKIMKDLGTPGDWDLPRDIRMENHAINKNCLGYAPAEKPHPLVVETFASLGITNDKFPAEFPEFCYNPDLMAVVMNALRGIRDCVLKPINLRTPDGSIGQILTSEISTQFSEYNNRSGATQHEWKGLGPIQLPSNVAVIANSFLYRRKIEKTRALMPNNFDSDDEIPEMYFDQFKRFHLDDCAIIGLDVFRNTNPSLDLGILVAKARPQ